MKLKKNWIKRIFVAVLLIGILGITSVFSINTYVKSVAEGRIISAKEAVSLENVDCILILGCGVVNGIPTNMLNDRLLQGVELYELGTSGKLLMSGDHGRVNYDEVGIMKKFAIDNGVPSEDVFMDHAGFSTYESLYRARDIFQAKKIIIVTQEYHLYRALYVAEKLGLEAYGVSANLRTYIGQEYYNSREILARNKDFLTAIFEPKPTYLGEAIPVNGNGNLTND